MGIREEKKVPIETTEKKEPDRPIKHTVPVQNPPVSVQKTEPIIPAEPLPSRPM